MRATPDGKSTVAALAGTEPLQPVAAQPYPVIIAEQRTASRQALVAGRENADRVISWAHAIELADPTPYLSGGELVMTTGLEMGPTSDEQYEYVARLSTVGVAALAFDTGTNFDRVPDGVLSAGDGLGLPILQVPADTPFIAITRAVIDELTADQLRLVQRVVDQQEVFARATLRDGIPGVVTSLSKALSATAVVIGTDGRPQIETWLFTALTTAYGGYRHITPTVVHARREARARRPDLPGLPCRPSRSRVWKGRSANGIAPAGTTERG
jgi:hypothetical protein